MSQGVNKIILIGNLTKDPELRQTQNNKSVANFTVASTTGFGEYEHTEFANCVTFGKTADALCQYCTKGDKVYLEGEMQTRKWTDKETKDRWTTEVKTFTIQFLSTKGEAKQSNQNQGGYVASDNVPF